MPIPRIGRTIRTPENEAILRRLAADKTPTVEIAWHFAATPRTIRLWARVLGVALNSIGDTHRQPEYRKIKRELSRKAYANPEFRQQFREIMREVAADPAFQAKVADFHADPEKRAIRVAALRDKRAQARRLISRYKINLELPRWVPDHMVIKFVNVARDCGEEEAASWARREKQLIHARDHA